MENLDIFLHTEVAMLLQRLRDDESMMLQGLMRHRGNRNRTRLQLYCDKPLPTRDANF